MQRKTLVLALPLFYLLTGLFLLAQETPNQTDRAAIENIVRDYILQHPEVIAQAANLYQAHERAVQKARAKEAVTTRLSDLQHDRSSPVTGLPMALPLSSSSTITAVIANASSLPLRNYWRTIPMSGSFLKSFQFSGLNR
jgi:hypothetical protein